MVNGFVNAKLDEKGFFARVFSTEELIKIWNLMENSKLQTAMNNT